MDQKRQRGDLVGGLREAEIMVDKEFDFTIVDEIGILSISSKGWTKEINLISWNGRDPKYDIRDWAPEYEKNG